MHWLQMSTIRNHPKAESTKLSQQSAIFALFFGTGSESIFQAIQIKINKITMKAQMQ